MQERTIILTQGEIKDLISMQDVIEVVEAVFRGHGDGTVVMPAKITLNLGEEGAWPHYAAGINSMPAYVGQFDAAGIKFAGMWQQNASQGLPVVMATIILVDPGVGRVLAVMEGALITALRTGAATAVGAKYLGKKDPRSVAIVGAGTQGRFQLRALAALRKPEDVRIYDIKEEAALSFVEEMSEELGLRITSAPGAREAVTDADIVVTCTHTHKPFLRGEWLGPGSLVCGLGSFEEIHDDVFLNADRIVVDKLEQALHRGSLARKVSRGVIGPDAVSCELGEIVAGKKPARQNDEERILLLPIGMGSEDVAVAHMVYQRALEKGGGTWIDFLA